MANGSVRVIVHGHVQGVWYRKHAREIAVDLGLMGRVRNLADGSVEAEVEGPEEKIQEFVAWCRVGPPQARVAQVISEPMTPRGYSGFEIDR